MLDTYDHSKYVEADIARYEKARRRFKNITLGYGEWQLNSRSMYASRVLTRSGAPSDRGVWCLADHYKLTGDVLTAGGWKIYLWLYDEESDTLMVVSFDKAMEVAALRPGRGSGSNRAPDYYEFTWGPK